MKPLEKLTVVQIVSKQFAKPVDYYFHEVCCDFYEFVMMSSPENVLGWVIKNVFPS